MTEPGREGDGGFESKIEGPRSGLPAEFWAFLKERKLWWMTPIVVVLVSLSALLFLAEGTAVAPFIYTLF